MKKRHGPPRRRESLCNIGTSFCCPLERYDQANMNQRRCIRLLSETSSAVWDPSISTWSAPSLLPSVRSRCRINFKPNFEMLVSKFCPLNFQMQECHSTFSTRSEVKSSEWSSVGSIAFSSVTDKFPQCLHDSLLFDFLESNLDPCIVTPPRGDLRLCI